MVSRDDPVVLVATGHTYERALIEEWLKNNNICPMTGQVITDKTLVTNWGMKSIFEELKTGGKLAEEREKALEEAACESQANRDSMQV